MSNSNVTPHQHHPNYQDNSNFNNRTEQQIISKQEPRTQVIELSATATTPIAISNTTTTTTKTSSINNNNNNNNNNINNHFPTLAPEASDSRRTIMSIQPTSFTKNHLLSNGSLSANDELSIRKRREDLSRRPSYRKIFNDLTGLGSPLDPQSHAPVPVPVPVSAPTAPGGIVVPAPPPPLQQQQPQTQSQQPAPVVTPDPSSAPPQPPPMMTNVGLHHHHHQHHPHSQQHHPQQQQQQHQQQQHQHQHQQQQHQQHQHQHPASHHSQASQLQQAHHMLNTSSPLMQDNIVGVGEEATKKRELRLQKNREAAKECRRKKKEYIKCLENRVAVLENQNKALIDELKTLKDLYCKSTNE